jgi:hypothetical protein
MKDIHEVLRRKQTKYAQLAKQIEMLQQAAEKLREVAPLLAENEEDEDNVVLSEVEDEAPAASTMAAKASAGTAAQPANAAKAARSNTPRWP